MNWRGALLWLLLAMQSIAADWYISPTGSSGNPGTLNEPWDLDVLYREDDNDTIDPGDTLWLRGGTYTGMAGTYIRVPGSAGNPITIRPYNRERVIINGYFNIISDYVTVRDLEFTDLSSPFAGPATFATRAAFEAALGVSYRRSGISADGDHGKVINCLIYNCTGTSGNGPNEWHGNIVMGVGAVFDDDSTIGEGLYAQNGAVADGLYATYEQNIYAMGPRGGMNLWAAGVGDVKRMYVVNNMTLFLGLVVRSGAEGHTVGDVFVTNNIVADTPNGNYANRDYPSILGYGFSNIEVTNVTAISNLVINGTLNLANLGSGIFAGNTICAVNDINSAMLIINGYAALTMSLNSYFCAVTANRVVVNSTVYTFPDYVTAINKDTDSSFTQTNYPAANRISYFTNKYEPGRMHIFVANFQSNDVVQLDLTNKGLAVGQAYEIRYVNNYFGPKITGSYDGQPVSLPMTNWTVAQPQWLTVARAGGSTIPLYSEPAPTWGAFVVLPGNTSTAHVTTVNVGL